MDAFYNWTREMPKGGRTATMAGIVLQAYPVYVLIERSAAVPNWLYPYILVFPKAPWCKLKLDCIAARERPSRILIAVCRRHSRTRRSRSRETPTISIS